MGAKQSKRSVDISGKEAESAGEVAAAGAGGEGRVEPLADADALKPQLNGDAHIHEQTDKEKQLDSGTPENEKDATTEKESKQEENEKEKEVTPITNGESEEQKTENGDSTPTPEDSKKPKKEKVKKKWSLRSISFSRKEKPKQEKKQKEEEPKTNGEPEKVPEEAAEVTAEPTSNEVEEAKTETESKDEKTPETPVTEPITNGSTTPESPKEDITPVEEVAPVASLDEDKPETKPELEPEQLPVNGLSLEEAKSEAPEVEKSEESKPKESPAESSETVPAIEIPVTKEVCVEQMPLIESTPPPLPANPPPSSVASFAATTMAPDLTDASLANTAENAISTPPAVLDTITVMPVKEILIVSQTDLTETNTVTEVAASLSTTTNQVVSKAQDIVDKPEEIVDKPQGVVEKPEEVVEKPQEVVDKPEEVVDKPKEVVDKSEEVVEKPEEVVDKPEEVVEKSQDFLDNPLEVVDNSQEIVANSQEIVNNTEEHVKNTQLVDNIVESSVAVEKYETGKTGKLFEGVSDVDKNVVNKEQILNEITPESIQSHVESESLTSVEEPENILPQIIEDLPLPPPPTDNEIMMQTDVTIEKIEPNLEPAIEENIINHSNQCNGDMADTEFISEIINGNEETEQRKKKTKNLLENVLETIECNGNVIEEPKEESSEAISSLEETGAKDTTPSESLPPSPSEGEAGGAEASDSFPAPPSLAAASPPPPATPPPAQEPLPVTDKIADLIPEVPVVPDLKTETETTDVAVTN